MTFASSRFTYPGITGHEAFGAVLQERVTCLLVTRLSEHEHARGRLRDTQRCAMTLKRDLRHARQLLRRDNEARGRARFRANCRVACGRVRRQQRFHEAFSLRIVHRRRWHQRERPVAIDAVLHVLRNGRALHERAAHRFRQCGLEFFQAVERQRETDDTEGRESAGQPVGSQLCIVEPCKGLHAGDDVPQVRPGAHDVGDGRRAVGALQAMSTDAGSGGPYPSSSRISSSAASPLTPRRTSRGAFVDRYQKYDAGSSRYSRSSAQP